MPFGRIVSAQKKGKFYLSLKNSINKGLLHIYIAA